MRAFFVGPNRTSGDLMNSQYGTASCTAQLSRDSLVPRQGGYGLAFEAIHAVLISESSTLLTQCSTLVQLGSCELRNMKYDVTSINKKTNSISATAANLWRENNKEMVMAKHLCGTYSYLGR